MNPVRSRIEALEQSTVRPVWFALTFVSLVLLRNILEGALGPSATPGFVAPGGHSAVMVLDHFVLFYSSLFLAVLLLLSVLARERIGRVAKVLVPAWAVVLLPPVLDSLWTGGRGVHIRYVLELSPALLRFFHPGAALEGVSNGQRVEILLGCILASAYIAMKTRSAVRALVAFFAAYAIVVFHGLLPGAWALLNARVSADPAAAYGAAFKIPGIVPEEGRALALLFLFSSAVLGLAALFRHAPERLRAAVSNLRPLLSAHYAAMTGFGTALGWLVFRAAGVETGSGSDVLGAAALAAAVFLALQAAVAVNDLFDREADLVNEAARPLVTGRLSPGDLAFQAGVSSAAALLFALNVGYPAFLLMAFILSISVLYSVPPVRLKRFPVASSLALGLLSLLAAAFGLSGFAREAALPAFPRPLAAVLLFSIGLGFSAKDLKDTAGDRRTGVWTIPVLFGDGAGRLLEALLVTGGYMLVPILLASPMLWIPAVLLGGASLVAILLWRPRPIDRVLLALYLVFAVFVAASVLSDPGRLLSDETRLREEAVELRTSQGAAHDRQGRREFAEGRMRRAEAELRRAVALDPVEAPYWNNLAVALLALGSFEDALAALDRAGSLDPRLADTYLNRGRTLEAMGRPAEARKQYLLALEIDPESEAAREAAQRLRGAGAR